jgi:peptide/nickel transport system substrate-binding protein
MDLSRRDLIALGGLTLAGTALGHAPARAQTPKRGGTLTLRTWDPPHFDHMGPGGISYKIHIPMTLTHSRLLKHKAGPNVVPGTFPIEGDLAESWQQTNETTYVFKLRRGVRWHPKPPVNGRELTAEDVRYTVERFVTLKGNANAYMLKSLDKVEAVDKYTVKFTLKEPFAWFPDVLANPMALAIIAKECVDKFGDLKKAEAVVGTGPWMLDSYRPNQGLTFVRHPNYFLAGLPYIDRIEMAVDEDNASRMAAFMAGKYDLGWEFPGTINRVDWVQIKDNLRQKRPNLKTLEFPSNVMSHISMRTDQKPFSDVRVRQAISHAIDRKALIAACPSRSSWRSGPPWWRWRSRCRSASSRPRARIPCATTSPGASPSSACRCRGSGWPPWSSSCPPSGGAGARSRGTRSSAAIPSPTSPSSSCPRSSSASPRRRR